MKTTMKRFAGLLLSLVMILTTLATMSAVASAADSDTTANITGLALIVDGVEYTSGLVVINSESNVVLKAYGTNMTYHSSDNKIEYRNGSVLYMGPNYSWTASEDGTSATRPMYTFSFASVKSAYTLRYSNNDGKTWYTSAISVIYSDEVDAIIDSISITVDGKNYDSGNVTVYPYSNVTITANGRNLKNASANYAIKYDGINQILLRQMTLSADGNSATYTLKGSRFAKVTGAEIVYNKDYIQYETWEKTGIYVTYNEGEGAMILGTYINFGGDIEMKYAVWIANGEDRYSVKLKTVFHGDEKYWTYSEQKDGYYVFALKGINPQCLGDDIDAELYIGDEKVDEILDYSVEDYLQALDKNSLSNTEKQIVDDLLAYCTASEAYTGYESMSTDYEARETEIPAYRPGVIDTNSGISVRSVNVRFGSMICLMFSFKSDNGKPINLTTPIYINGEEATTYMDGDTLIAISKPIAPENFEQDVTLIYQDSNGDLSVSFSVNDYCYSITKEGSTASAKMKTLAQALYNYGTSVRAYADEK